MLKLLSRLLARRFCMAPEFAKDVLGEVLSQSDSKNAL
jgi:hypothetical protein